MPTLIKNLLYSNPKWIERDVPGGCVSLNPQKSTNDLGSLYKE